MTGGAHQRGTQRLHRRQAVLHIAFVGQFGVVVIAIIADMADFVHQLIFRVDGRLKRFKDILPPGDENGDVGAGVEGPGHGGDIRDILQVVGGQPVNIDLPLGMRRKGLSDEFPGVRDQHFQHILQPLLVALQCGLVHRLLLHRGLAHCARRQLKSGW